MDASLISIQPSAPDPIYRQIVGQISRMIVSGQLRPAETLPSVRDVAGFHAINPMTVSRAYSVLEADGFLTRLRGRGMVVAAVAHRTSSVAQRIELIEPHLQDIARQARELELPSEAVLRRLGNILES